MNKAYEFLVSTSKTRSEGPDPARIVLLLRTQSILFSRYGKILAPYKYAGYPMLIKTIQLETADEKLFSRETPLLPAASELAYHTVYVSALNAEELRRENGIDVVASALSRCMDVVGVKTKNEDTAAVVSMYIVKLLGVAAGFDACCEKIVEQPEIVRNVARCLYYKDISMLALAALECAVGFGRSAALQNLMADFGAIWHLVGYLFRYDYTLAEGGIEAAVESNKQETANHSAVMAFRALGRMGGYLTGTIQLKRDLAESVAVSEPDTELTVEEASSLAGQNELDLTSPVNDRVRRAMEGLLTWHLARQLSSVSASSALKMINSNAENPYLIWNNGIRADLLEYVERQGGTVVRIGEQDEDLGASFLAADLKGEYKVGNVYLRIYIDQPSFVLEDTDGFVNALVVRLRALGEVLYRPAPPQPPEDAPADSEQAQAVAKYAEDRTAACRESSMCLHALATVLSNHPESATLLVAKFKLLFYFLRVDDDEEVQVRALQAIGNALGNRDCVTAIGEAGVLQNVLLLVATLPVAHPEILAALQGLFSSPKIVAEGLAKGALIYMLQLVCNSKNPAVRIGAALVITKMAADKLHGPRVVLALAKYLPPIFLDAMRESPEAAVHMFEGTHENPELIWEDETRQRVQQTIKKLCRTFYEEQSANPIACRWSVPMDMVPIYQSASQEFCVGGIFLRLFLKQPNWGLRNPKDFLTALYDKMFEEANANVMNANPDTAAVEVPEEPIRSVAEAIVLLVKVQTVLASYLFSLGLVQRTFSLMRSPQKSVLVAAALVSHELASHQVCVEAMTAFPSIELMMSLMRGAPSQLHLAADTLRLMFESTLAPEKGSLVKNALDAQLIPFVMGILDSALEIDNSSAVKAQLVKAMKAMTRDVTYGEAARQELDASPVWASFRDQRHDLFLTTDTVRGLLTGPTGPSTKGYLTSSTTPSASVARVTMGGESRSVFKPPELD